MSISQKNKIFQEKEIRSPKILLERGSEYTDNISQIMIGDLLDNMIKAPYCSYYGNKINYFSLSNRLYLKSLIERSFYMNTSPYCN